MNKLILLLCFLFTFALVPNPASGQQGEAVYKIVKNDDGTVKIFDLQGDEIRSTSAAADAPAPVQSTLMQTGNETNPPSASMQINSDGKAMGNPAKAMNPGPDLCLGSPFRVYSHPNLMVSIEVMNNGTARSGSCYLGCYLSKDWYVGSDIHLGNELVNPMRAGEHLTLNLTFNLGSYAGEWWMILIIDDTRVVEEDNESNNTDITQTYVDGPNLTCDCRDMTFDPTTRQLDVSVRVINSGVIKAESSVLGFYLSASETHPNEGPKLGDVPVFSLNPGAYSDKSFTVSDVGTYVSSGTWYVWCIADETNAVTEIYEDDNWDRFLSSITVTCPLPNLTMQRIPNGFQYDSSTRQLEIRVRVINNGTAPAGPSTLGYYLSADTEISSGDRKIGTDDVPSLNIGSSSDEMITIGDVSNYVKAGTWYAGFIIDETNAVPESDESDNTCSITPSITVNYHLTIDASPTGSGSVGKDPNKSGFEYGEAVQLMANTAPGYRFSHWSGDLSGNDNPANLIMDGDKTVSAVFVENNSTAYILVTNCDDVGPGSFREAIHIANRHSGPDTILFAIPEGAPGYQVDAGTWVIQPQSELPLIIDGKLLIFAFSQSTFIGRDTNPDGPEIVLDGYQAGQNASGLHVAAPEVSIVGLTIHRYSNVGIWMDRVDVGHIAGCYIGTDHSGTVTAPNGLGICIGNHCQHVTVAPMDTFRNVITGNLNGGILVSDSSHAINILNNIVGLDRTANAAPGNGGFGGLSIQQYCDSVIVIDNWICGNICGLLLNNTAHNSIQSNWIGISPKNLDIKPGDLIPITGNKNDGIYIAGQSTDNLISQNIICQNQGPGVGIYGEQPIRNRISQNCISQNIGPGIFYASAGANKIPAPIITNATSTFVSGTAIPDATIEIYTDSEDEGQMFQGETQSGPDGRFNWTGVIAGPLPNITAIAIDAESNTSPFSMVFVTAVEEPNIISTPSLFSLGQNYPNPFNPVTVISYTIPSTSMVRLTVYDLLGKEVATLVNEVKQSGVHQAKFNGVNCPSGLYFYTLEAGGNIIMQKMMLLK